MGKNRKNLWELAKGTLASLLAMGIIALPGYLAWIQEMPLFLIPLSILFSISFLFLGLNLYRQWKRQQGLSRAPEKKIERIIREWVDIQEWSFQREVPEETLFFKFSLTAPEKKSVTILRPKKAPNIIQILTTVKELPPIPKLFSLLSIEMARLGINYHIDRTNKEIKLVREVILDEYINRFQFRENVFFVLRAVVLVIATAQQFDSPQPIKS